MGVVWGSCSAPVRHQLSRFSEFARHRLADRLRVLTAFGLEATFLGILLFGWTRFPPWLVTLAVALVAIGTAISAF